MAKSKFVPIIFVFTTILLSSVWVQAAPGGLAGRVAALEAQVAEQAGYISTLQEKVAALEEIFDGVSRNVDDIFFDGVNVHVRSGSGATNGDTGSGPSVNGLGNIIVGYDELRTDDINEKNGSHNLVVGPQNNYSSYGGLAAGIRNWTFGPNASVSGGAHNAAVGDYSSVSGGEYNIAFQTGSSISGGFANDTSGDFSSVSGGVGNEATDAASSVSGGWGNIASGFISSVSGGEGNTASGELASVSGGNGRTASGNHDWVAGGLFEDN
jgi:hypothetical protein